MRFNNTCSVGIKKEVHVKGTTYFGGHLKQHTHLTAASFSQAWHQMLLLLEIRPVPLVSRKESDGFSIT